MLEKVERFISEINRIHLEYSKDYFETGKVEKINLKHTFAKFQLSRFYPIVLISTSQLTTI